MCIFVELKRNRYRDIKIILKYYTSLYLLIIIFLKKQPPFIKILCLMFGGQYLSNFQKQILYYKYIKDYDYDQIALIMKKANQILEI